VKDKQLQIQFEQLASELNKEINSEADIDRNCRLQDAKELLRQAWHVVADIPTEPNDLTSRPWIAKP